MIWVFLKGAINVLLLMLPFSFAFADNNMGFLKDFWLLEEWLKGLMVGVYMVFALLFNLLWDPR